jgi:serine/threonine protein phosphatase 1
MRSVTFTAGATCLEKTGRADRRRLKVPAEGTKRVLVFLGDYIDRGLQSKDVIDFMLSDRIQAFERVFLMGNHEEALLRFSMTSISGSNGFAMAAPKRSTPMAFSRRKMPVQRCSPMKPCRPISAPGTRSGPSSGTAARTSPEVLPEPPALLCRPATTFSCMPACVPGESLEKQTVRDMLWIREEFLDAEEQFPQVVVHGHTPTDGSLSRRSPDRPGYRRRSSAENFQLFAFSGMKFPSSRPETLE